MSDVKFSFAKSEDTDLVMSFISNHWNNDHIFTKSKELLDREFRWIGKKNSLTIALAWDPSRHIVGIFCFKFFNYQKIPDLTGSIWKVTPEAESKYPMIGYRLRQYVIDNIEHRFFSAPGPTLETMAMYKMLRYQWNQMKQYYIINPLIEDYQLIDSSDQITQSVIQEKKSNIIMKKVEDVKDLSNFDFDLFSNILPFKDKKYIENRFFEYPYFNYDIYLVHERNKKTPQNIVICRRAIGKDDLGNKISSAYRIVDFYGSEELLPEIIAKLIEKMKSNGDEFLDFICHGFDDSLLKKAGMLLLDTEDPDTVIPNWFEPLVKKNIPVYCVAYKTNYLYRQCKADGDQDRPSMIT